MIRRRLRSTLFPYTTLFRSLAMHRHRALRLADRELGFPPGRPDFRASREGLSLQRTVAQTLGNPDGPGGTRARSGEDTSEIQSRQYLVCRLLLAKNPPTNNC